MVGQVPSRELEVIAQTFSDCQGRLAIAKGFSLIAQAFGECTSFWRLLRLLATALAFSDCLGLFAIPRVSRLLAISQASWRLHKFLAISFGS